MTEHAVVIAGGGPTGLMLAGELALAGIDVAIVERRASQALVGSRAGGLHARTIEVLDQRGIADRFVSQGQVYPVAGFAMIQLDISDFPTRHNYVLGLTQNHIERILAEWIGELGVKIYREREVTGLTQDDTGVDVDAVRRSVAARGISRRLRRRTQRDPQISRHRVPRMGSDDELADRRGRDGRGTGMGIPHRRTRQPCHRPEGSKRAGWDRADRTARRDIHYYRTHAARCQRGAHRHLRHRLRDPQSHLDLEVHRHDSAGRDVSREARPARWRRRAHTSPDGWTGPQHRCAGRGESRMEAGAGGEADVAGQPARYVPRRASSRRRARAEEHDGAGRASPPRRPYQGAERYRFRVAQDG